MTFYDKLVESKYIPLFVYRIAIRFLLGSLLRKKKKEFQNNGDSHTSMIKFLSEGSIAVETDSANNQHYEVNSQFYKLVLGDNLKYSASFYKDDYSIKNLP